MINDPVVLDQMKKKDSFKDDALYAKLESKLNLPRYLDEPPKPVKLGGPSKEDIIGTAAEFKAFYNMNFDSSKVDDIATIDLSTLNPAYGQKTCDYVVFNIIKTLILVGVTRNQERATACREIFMRIISLPKQHISKGDVYTLIESREEYAKGYFNEIISEALIDCMCTDEEKLRFHIKMCVQDFVPNWVDVYNKLCESFTGVTPYEFDKEMKEKCKDVKKRTYLTPDEKKLPSAVIVGLNLLNGEQTCESLILTYVQNPVWAAKLKRKYSGMTSMEMIEDLKKIYVSSGKKLTRDMTKLFEYAGGKL